MTIKINSLLSCLVLIAFSFSACKKTTYNFGELKAPSNLVLNAVVQGQDAGNPAGNGSGVVAIEVTATDALNYKVDFGDGTSQMVPSGVINYKYSSPGTADYTITVNAIGTGGVVSTISKRVTVYVAFVIPPTILEAMTGNSSKKWETDKAAPGHVGVGPATEFSPIWYSADPNTRSACQYDDEITFTKDATGSVIMTINNGGESFSIGAATASYGFTGGDGCYAINTADAKKLIFSDATSASTPANSTRIQFKVPGNGFVNFGTGGNTYEILSITNTTMHLRNIGSDGNAWYQKLKQKP